MKRIFIYLVLVTVAFTFTIHDSIAQNVKWHAVVGGGFTDMRNFTDGMEAVGYTYKDGNGDMQSYTLRNKPSFMISAGLGASGTFSKEGMLGWDAQMRVRSGGFKVFVDGNGKNDAIESIHGVPQAQLGKTKAFTNLSLHVPLSITYIPFEVVGFTIGTDFYYQLSSDPSKNNYPEGKFSSLDNHIGMSQHAKYKYPFNVGAHLGVFVPIGDRLRIDAQVFSDLASRLRFQRNQSAKSENDNQYKEMGLSISVGYKLNW